MNSAIEQLTRNELRIFRAVYERGPISRVRVANRLNLTRPAVTLYTKKLAEAGLISEVGKGESSPKRGRREIMLSVNPEAGVFLAIHISLTVISFGLIKLNGQLIEKEKKEFHETAQPEEILDSILSELNTMLSRHNFTDDQIFGISVTLPGILNYNAGTVQETVRREWEGFNIKKFIRKRTKLRVLIENDVKALTLAEFYFGIGRRVNDMVCLWWKNGIGAGIILNGKLLRGFSSSAGEIGFNKFVADPNVKKSILIDKSVKYWGNILSYVNIQNTIKRGIKNGWKTHLTDKSTIDDFKTAFRDNDPLARYIFELLSTVLGSISCNLAYSYNPKVLVLAGPLFEEIPDLAIETKHHMDKGDLKSALEILELKTGILGEDGFLIGCVALYLEQIFKAADSHILNDEI